MKILFMLFALCGIGATYTLFAQTTKTFEVDFAITQERIKDLGGVNAGPDVLVPKGSTVTPPAAILGYRESGVTSIRVHDVNNSQYFEYVRNFWTSGTNPSINAAFDPNLASNYAWTNLDAKIDSIANFGFMPYFRLGVNFGSSFPYPPFDADKRNFAKFASTCAYTVRHYNDAWSNGRRLGIKYWEIWNEPDSPGFWKDSLSARGIGDSAAFVRMYKTVSDSLKRLDPTLKVGAAGVLSGTILSKRMWTSYFINACRDNRAALDFFSWHLYDALNPYSVKIQGDYVRGMLDAAGFTTAESHITEWNIRLGENDARLPVAQQLINRPKHAAFTASAMIAAQMGTVDKMFAYRGTTFMNFFASDTLGKGAPTLAGRGFAAFTALTRFTPQRIQANGSEFIATEASSTRDTTNVMILAGRSDDRNRAYILVSNYNSRYTAIEVNLKNLSWQANGKLTLTQTTMNAAGTFTDVVETLQVASTLRLAVASFAAPALALFRLEYQVATGVSEKDEKETVKEDLTISPNPSSNQATVRFRLAKPERVRLVLYNARGNEVLTVFGGEKSAGVHEISFSTSALSQGSYTLRLEASTFSQTQSVQVLR